MSDDLKHTGGVAEEAAQFEAATRKPLLARPTPPDFDWEGAMDKIEERFAKTLARLAE